MAGRWAFFPDQCESTADLVYERNDASGIALDHPRLNGFDSPYGKISYSVAFARSILVWRGRLTIPDENFTHRGVTPTNGHTSFSPKTCRFAGKKET
jgi:hypothetical protein